MSLLTREPFEAEQEIARLQPHQQGAAAAFLAAHPPGAGAPLCLAWGRRVRRACAHHRRLEAPPARHMAQELGAPARRVA